MPHRGLLLVRVAVNAGPVLSAPVAALAVLLSRVDSAEENCQELVQRYLRRLVMDLRYHIIRIYFRQRESRVNAEYQLNEHFEVTQ